MTNSAWAQTVASTPWVLTPDMGYAYDKDGKTFSYKMGTGNAQVLLKGAKKVPKGTLFFIGVALRDWLGIRQSCEMAVCLVQVVQPGAVYDGLSDHVGRSFARLGCFFIAGQKSPERTMGMSSP
jgi:hypothetical protein